MAQAREAAFNPSSPHSSSGGADSYKHDGTPDTRLTAFSPEESSARSSKLLKALNLSTPNDQQPVRFHVQPNENYCAAPTTEKDPFISSSTTPKTDQKLSPTASSFRPVSSSIPVVAHGSLNGLHKLNTTHLGLNATQKFSNELDVSRYLHVFSPTQAISVSSVDDYIKSLGRIRSSSHGKPQIFSVGGKAYVRFTNIRDALDAHNNIQAGGIDWHANFITPQEYYQAANPGVSIEPVSEAQIYVVAMPVPGINFGAMQSEIIVHGFLQQEGEIFAYQRLSDLNDSTFRGLFEFCDTDLAVSIASKFNGVTIGGLQLLLTLFKPDIMNLISGSPEASQSSQAQVHDVADMFRNMNLSRTTHALVPTGRPSQTSANLHMPHQQIAMYPVVYSPIQAPTRYVLDQTPTRSQSIPPMAPLTPLSSGMSVMGSIYTPPATPMTLNSEYSPRSMQQYGRPDSRRQNAMRVNRSPYYNAAGHHNHVDVNRIREGIDVRTTIMLRNIPNKVDQAMLKRIVDESSWGKYDFMYLRIDFANDCNVGYAFINFVDPLDIIDFVNARGNQRWNCFKSDKVAEISYATIQGKDCLVQKFRNSSVMLEAPHYRPKLYFTSNGPRPDLAGEEEQFPDPDNQSKMKRSCENAEHVGLFTPNAGQHFRDEQRRRRSQYDRGTRLAALEEYDYETHIQQPGLFPPQ